MLETSTQLIEIVNYNISFYTVWYNYFIIKNTSPTETTFHCGNIKTESMLYLQAIAFLRKFVTPLTLIF